MEYVHKHHSGPERNIYILGLLRGWPYLHPDIVFTTKDFDAVATFSCATCEKIVYTVSLGDPRDRSQHWRLADILGSYCPITRQRSDDWNVVTTRPNPIVESGIFLYQQAVVP